MRSNIEMQERESNMRAYAESAAGLELIVPSLQKHMDVNFILSDEFSGSRFRQLLADSSELRSRLAFFRKLVLSDLSERVALLESKRR